MLNQGAWLQLKDFHTLNFKINTLFINFFMMPFTYGPEMIVTSLVILVSHLEWNCVIYCLSYDSSIRVEGGRRRIKINGASNSSCLSIQKGWRWNAGWESAVALVCLSSCVIPVVWPSPGLRVTLLLKAAYVLLNMSQWCKPTTSFGPPPSKQWSLPMLNNLVGF